jgi:hypothetical protein
VTDAVRTALEQLPISDISVEDPPLEEVMREFLSGDRLDNGGNTAT